MATKKKTQKKKTTSRKEPVARKKLKTDASASSRKMSVKAKSKKSITAKAKSPNAKSKFRPKAAANAIAPRKAAAKVVKRSKEKPVRVFRSTLPSRGESQDIETVDLDTKGAGSNSGGQSGDLQGLSNIESADSESVGELLEEGNSFEAEVVKGVQDAPDADVSEVHTHQRPQEEDLAEDFREN